MPLAGVARPRCSTCGARRCAARTAHPRRPCGVNLIALRQQVPHHLLQAVGVAGDRAGAGVELERRARCPWPRPPGARLDRRLDDADQVDGARRRARSLPVMMRDTSSRSSMSWACSAALRSIVSSAAARRVGVEAARAQQLRPAEDGVERRAQLVRQRGQELVLDAVGLQQLGVGATHGSSTRFWPVMSVMMSTAPVSDVRRRAPGRRRRGIQRPSGACTCATTPERSCDSSCTGTASGPRRAPHAGEGRADGVDEAAPGQVAEGACCSAARGLRGRPGRRRRRARRTSSATGARTGAPPSRHGGRAARRGWSPPAPPRPPAASGRRRPRRSSAAPMSGPPARSAETWMMGSRANRGSERRRRATWRPSRPAA